MGANLRALMIRRDYAPVAQSPRRGSGVADGRTRLAVNSSYADVGARYAQALFELAEQGGVLTAVESDLKGFERLRAESADFARLLASPAISHEDRARALLAIADAAGVDPLTRKFLGLLAANNRVPALTAVAVAFRKLVADKRGQVAAEVVSAAPLTAAQSAGIAAALRQALGKDPEVTTRVDPTLLGGLRVKVGSRLFDASLRTRLDHMKFALKRA
jgi:F-type H+-transporting ATPase subunit delta